MSSPYEVYRVELCRYSVIKRALFMNGNVYFYWILFHPYVNGSILAVKDNIEGNWMKMLYYSVDILYHRYGNELGLKGINYVEFST
jgi:hypothetical protein